MASREQNERTFGRWEQLPGGGRRYVKELAGRTGGFARYWKEVDAVENTVRFWQEIYDRNRKLVAKHDKFPVDSSHQNV